MGRPGRRHSHPHHQPRRRPGLCLAQGPSVPCSKTFGAHLAGAVAPTHLGGCCIGRVSEQREYVCCVCVCGRGGGGGGGQRTRAHANADSCTAQSLPSLGRTEDLTACPQTPPSIVCFNRVPKAAVYSGLPRPATATAISVQPCAHRCPPAPGLHPRRPRPRPRPRPLPHPVAGSPQDTPLSPSLPAPARWFASLRCCSRSWRSPRRRRPSPA